MTWKELKEKKNRALRVSKARIGSAIYAGKTRPKGYRRIESKPESEKPNQQIFTRGKIENTARNKHITLPKIKF
jgi:hypothetical protein